MMLSDRINYNVMVYVRVEMLGGLRIVHDGHSTTQFRTLKTAVLLARLAFTPGRSFPRDELVEMLWPDADVESGRSSLRTSLSALRRQLEPKPEHDGKVLIADRFQIRLSSETAASDAHELSEAFRRAKRDPRPDAIEHAVSLYKGPLLPAAYDDWVVAERTRLEQQVVCALRSLAVAREAEGRNDGAIDALRRLIALDPADESAHAELIRLLAAGGRGADARRQYRDLEKILREQFGARPSPEVSQLLEGLARHNVARGISVSGIHTSPSLDTEPTSVPSPPKAPTPPSEAPLLMRMDRFVGRKAELDEIEALLTAGAARLVTLTGTGGAGKTRLAQEALARVSGRFHGAAWFVPLADVESAGLLADALLHALQITRRGDMTPLDQVVDALTGRTAIVCLDNLEQIVDEAAPVIHVLLSRLPGITVLATSRQKLDLSAEHEVTLGPLPTPDLAGTPERLLEFASVQLFVERARSARRGFELTPTNSSAVTAICRQLEGLPLAIELAAAAIAVLTPEQLKQRFAQGLAIPAATRRDIPERHRSLRAAILGSFRTLDAALQQFLGQLAVFCGGWTLEAAEAVCEEPAAFDFLRALRDRSLVVAQQAGDEMRFRLLEPIREFAREQTTPADRAALSERHRDWYLRFATAAANQLDGPDKAALLDRLERDVDNFREALHLSEAHDSAAYVALCGSLWRFWWLRGYWREGLDYLERALALPEASIPARAEALAGAGLLQSMLAEYGRARTYQEEALRLCREIGDAHGTAAALHDLGSTLLHCETDVKHARSLVEEALHIRQRIGDHVGVAQTLNTLGNAAYDQKEFDAAWDYYEQSLELRRRLQDDRGTAASLNNLGVLAERAGDLNTARRRYEESLGIWRKLGDRWGISLGVGNLGLLALEENDPERARPYLVESLRIRWSLGDRRLVIGAIHEMYRLFMAEERYWCAAVLVGCTHAARELLGVVVRPFEEEQIAGYEGEIRDQLGSERYEAAVAEGRAMSLEQGCAYALEEGETRGGGVVMVPSGR